MIKELRIKVTQFPPYLKLKISFKNISILSGSKIIMDKLHTAQRDSNFMLQNACVWLLRK